MTLEFVFGNAYGLLKSESSFDKLLSQVSHLLGLVPDTFVLQYEDEEGDTLTLGSQLEFLEAMRVFQGKTLRLKVVPRDQLDLKERNSVELGELEAQSQALNINEENSKTSKCNQKLFKQQLKLKKKEFKVGKKCQKIEKKQQRLQMKDQCRRLKEKLATVEKSLSQEEKQQLSELKQKLKDLKQLHKSQICLLKAEMFEKKLALKKLKCEKQEKAQSARKEILDFLSPKLPNAFEVLEERKDEMNMDHKMRPHHHHHQFRHHHFDHHGYDDNHDRHHKHHKHHDHHGHQHRHPHHPHHHRRGAPAGV